MNQRSADPKVQAARLVRRRPMFASTPALQPTVTWVNTDCAPIRWSYRFFWEVTERGNIPFVGCPGTKLGFSIDEKPKHNNGDDNDDFNNWQSPCKWMVCSALLLIHQISMNSIKATAPSQDFFCYKQCRYRSSFSFCDWLRIWRRLNCSPLKPLTCSCIDFSSYNRPWQRGYGKSVWGMENA